MTTTKLLYHVCFEFMKKEAVRAVGGEDIEIVSWKPNGPASYIEAQLVMNAAGLEKIKNKRGYFLFRRIPDGIEVPVETYVVLFDEPTITFKEVNAFEDVHILRWSTCEHNNEIIEADLRMHVDTACRLTRNGTFMFCKLKKDFTYRCYSVV